MTSAVANPAQGTEKTHGDAGRAPLLHLFIPAATGIVLAKCFDEIPPLPFALASLAIASGLLALEFLPRAKSGKWFQVLWQCLFPAGISLLFAAYGTVRLPSSHADMAALPPRFAQVSLRVLAVYPADSYGQVRGIARVEKAPPIQDHLTGQKVLFVLKGTATLETGSRFDAKGLVRRMNPSAANDSYAAWLERSAVYFEIRRMTILGPVAPPGRVDAFANHARGWMREKLLAGSEKLPEIRALVPAMMLGDKALMSREDKTLFRETGMMHLFAVSGLHVGLVALVVEALLALAHLTRTRRILAGQAVLLAYVIAIGSPPSAVRAFLMILFFRVGRLWGRPARGLPSLAASAVAVLLWQPLQLFDVGAQLSYGIVAAILLYGIPLGEFLKKRFTQEDFLPPDDLNLFRRRKMWITARLWENTSISLAAFAASLPLCVAYFGYLAPVSVLLNLAMIPLALVAAVASVLAIALFLAATLPLLAFLGNVAKFVNHASWFTSWLMERLASAAHAVPLSHFSASFAAPWQGPALAATVLALMAILGHVRFRVSLFWRLSPLWALGAALGAASAIELLA
jgi:competence protein ComEC